MKIALILIVLLQMTAISMLSTALTKRSYQMLEYQSKFFKCDRATK